MPEAVQQVVGQIGEVWTGLGRIQRAAILGIGGVTVVALVWLTVTGNRPDLVTLYANLSPADAGQIVEQLKSNRVPYRVEDGGTRLLVPAAAVHETRIKLATAGLPQGGGVGFELFDRTSFGATDFVQKLNYQRALQGELARSITQLREVQQARVHIVLPQPSIFSERERPTTASVVLTLRPGARLAPEQVRGVVHLVSSSVEGLDADRVTVVDAAGRMLTQVADRPGAAHHLERQAGLELELQRRVQSMLDEVLGPGKTSVRVAAQVEFSHGERTEERVDPNSVVKSEQRSSETSKGSSTRPGGVVGSAGNTNTPGAGTVGTANSNETVKEQESVQYEVGRVVERRTLVAGEIKRLSVAVLVDPPYKIATGANGAEQRVPLPRKAAELEKLRAMVMRAVGYNAARGDEVEVAEMVFDTSTIERERVVAERIETKAFWWGIAQQGAWIDGLLLLAVLGLRTLKGLMGQRKPVGSRLDITEAALTATAAAEQIPPTIAAALNPADLAKAREREALHDQITELTRANPDQVAQLVRTWMLRKRTS
jgi:flagellar M-ring protein FliF